METTRDLRGRFGKGNLGNPKPHNVRSDEERQVDHDIRQLAHDLRKNSKSIDELVSAAEPVLLALAIKRAELDDGVLAGALYLMATRREASNAAELALRCRCLA
ncbi:MAG: hypothetical protein ACRER3_18900 [Pseudomonas fluorescens]